MVRCPKSKLCFILAILLLFIQESLLAQKTWTGNGDAISWFDESNWTPIGVPSVNDVVTIDDPTAFIRIAPTSPLDTAYAKALHIDDMTKLGILAGRVLSVQTQGNENISVHVKKGIFSVDGDLYIQGATVDGFKIEGGVSAGIAATGSMHILNFANFANGKGIHILSGCILDNKGHLTIRGGGLRSKDGIVSNGTLNNSGLLEIDDLQGNNIYYGIESSFQIFNSGTIAIDSIPGSSGIHTFSDSAIIYNYGTITTSAILNTSKAGVNIADGATLGGTGIINSHLVNVVQSGSTIEPFLGATSMTINADLNIGIDANWILNIAGIDGPNSLSGHAQVILNGDLTLEDNATTGPEFHVVLEGGFVPNDIDNFSFLDYSGMREGDFDDVIDQPSSQVDWGVFEVAQELVYRKACASPNSVATCGGLTCPIYTGAISGNGSVVFDGAFEVQSGEQYDIIFPETELNEGFTVNEGTVLNVTAATCSF